MVCQLLTFEEMLSLFPLVTIMSWWLEFCFLDLHNPEVHCFILCFFEIFISFYFKGMLRFTKRIFYIYQEDFCHKLFFMNYITFICVYMMNHLYIFGIKPIFSWCFILNTKYLFLNSVCGKFIESFSVGIH